MIRRPAPANAARLDAFLGRIGQLASMFAVALLGARMVVVEPWLPLKLALAAITFAAFVGVYWLLEQVREMQ